MIQNWELTNRIDPKTGSIHYYLLTDGTEQDVRVLARKLKGYVKDISPTQAAPYAYLLELPIDMDENTQDRVRTAIEEGISQAKRIDEFVPGGALGDPLFSANTSLETKTAMSLLAAGPHAPEVSLNLDTAHLAKIESLPPHATEDETHVQQLRVVMNDTPETAVVKEITPEGTQLSTVAREVFATRPPIPQQPDNAQPPANTQPPTPQQPAATQPPISISDQDMLLKDMEQSVLGKIPLDDILSASTRYDMFVDVNQLPSPQPAEKPPRAPAPAEPPPDTPKRPPFNVFEPNTAEPDPLLEVEEIHTITDKIAKKNMDFIKPMNTPEEEPKNTSAAPQGADAQPAAPQPTQNPGEFDDLDLPTLPHIRRQNEQAAAAAQEPELTLRRDALPDITVRRVDPQLSSINNDAPEPEVNSLQDMPDVSAAQPQQPAQQQKPTKTVLHLRPLSALNEVQTPSPELGKTILRLRRKDAAPSADTVRIKPLRSTVSAEKTALNLKANSSKPIDHSIEIPISELKKHNWSLEVPLVPTYTMNNMVMSVNRFAHATAISVIDNPGKMYNPLVLHGTTGTGKTHFLNAMAVSFGKKFGQEHIFMTNGVRLSRGIQRYVMEGNIAKFEDFMQSVQVLLIDDIHLLAINEQNRECISKLLNSFLSNQKQIVITSKYPPESLEKLEELIKFRLDSGWISELKPATGATHFRIVKKMLIENGVDLNDTQIEEFFGGKHMTLGTVTRSIRRLKVLENLIFHDLQNNDKSQAGIFEKLLATKGEDPTSELLTKEPANTARWTPTGNGEWGRIGVFYPQNCSSMMNWIVYALGQRAKELGIEGGFDIVVRSSYSTESIISSAFKIDNLCDNKKLKGAIILGPQPNTCDPSVRENFYDILTHMLEIMLIRCGIINYEDVRLPSTYVKIISELMR